MAFRVILPLLCFFAVASCATLSEDACRGGDWTNIGFRDGAEGRSFDFVEKHAKACAEFGIAPDVKSWSSGRTKGLALYCTPERAYSEGREGNRLRPVCEGYDQRPLEHANIRGLNYHDLTQDILGAENRLSEISSLLAALPDGDPARAGLVSERTRLRMQNLRLRSRRTAYL